MPLRSKRAASMAILVLALPGGAAQGQSVARAAVETASDIGGLRSDYVTVAAHVDEVRAPHSLWNVARDCVGNESCAAALQSLSESYGVPFDKIVATAALLATRKEGEGTYTTIGLPANYRYCRADMKMRSIVPRDGERGALFLGQARDAGFYYETWTPIRIFGEGRTWVEADITVLGVRADLAEQAYASGRCARATPPRAIFYCRGSGCVDTADDGQAVDTSSPPGAGGRK